MAEKQYDNWHLTGSDETERKARQITFDVYVGRIPPDWTKEKLMDIFQPFGEIKSIDLKSSPEYFNGQQIAFVRYPKEEMAKKAVDTFLHSPIENVKLQVNMAQRSKYKDSKDRQGNLDFSQPRSKTYSELKRTNQADFRRGRTRHGEAPEYGGGYGNFSYGQKKEWNADRQKSREDQETVVLVTDVESPVRFWAQLARAKVAHHLSTASDELQCYCPTGLKVNENSLFKNKIYGGIYPVDNLWYRCTIIKFLQQGMVTVRYIDFGNTEKIKKESLVELPPSLSDARPFAHLYHLAECEVSNDPCANEMTYGLGVEQLKNLVIGKLVNVKILSENPHGGVNVTVSYPGETGKTINELMLDGGCVQKTRPHNDRRRIEMTVAEKPLNESHKGSSLEMSPKDNNANIKEENLKLTIKFQSETICNLNKLFETVKQQYDDLCSEMDQAIKMKTILTAVTDLCQSRCATASVQDRTTNVDAAILFVTDSESRLTLDRVESLEKLCSSLDALKLAQDFIRNCEDKEKLKEIVENRNKTREELLENIKNFMQEMSSFNVNERGQKLEEILKKLSIFHHRCDGEVSLEDAIKNYKDWKGKPQQNDVKSAQQATDDISRKLAQEFSKIVKILNPDEDCTPEDCGPININPVAMQYSEAVAAELQQSQESDDTEEIEILAPLIKRLKKEIQQELTDIKQLRARAEECLRIQGDLETSMSKEPDVSKILEVRKNVKTLKSKYRHKLADKKDLEESDGTVDENNIQQVEKDLADLRTQLHSSLIEENIALEELAVVAVENFPELSVQYPEFGLEKFITSNGIVRQGYELLYYSHGEMDKVLTSSRGEVAFLTEFNGKKCLLKEFSLEDINDVEAFEAQATAYSRVEHSNLMKLEALFYDKTHRKAFIQLPYYETSLMKWLESNPSEKAKRDVICDIVGALFALQKAGITHGSVLMDNIYIDNNGRGILGEYCFIHDTKKRVSLTAELLLQNSVPISCDTSPIFDMFCLGEMAWVIFLGDEPVPRDMTSLQKHSASKAVSFMLAYLLALNGGARPMANQLLQHPFFTDENYLDVMDKTAPHDQVKPQETQEKSPPVESTLSEENIQPSEGTVPVVKSTEPDEKDTRPDESTLQEENKQPGENTVSEVGTLPGESSTSNTQSDTSIPHEENSQPEISFSPEIIPTPNVSTTPGVNTELEVHTPQEEQHLPGFEPLSTEETSTGTVLLDEILPVEEALPEEYAITQRKPLLHENGLKTDGTVNGNSYEKIEQGSCEPPNEGTQG